MFRSKRNKDTPEPEVAPAPTPTSDYQKSELRTFDGKGHPMIIVYTRDAQGRTIKTLKKVRRGDRRGDK